MGDGAASFVAELEEKVKSQLVGWFGMGLWLVGESKDVISPLAHFSSSIFPTANAHPEREAEEKFAVSLVLDPS